MSRLSDFQAPPARSSGIGAGYTVFVRLLKILLPVTALVIVGLVFARLSHSPLHEVEVAATQKETTTPGEIAVHGARYEGADSDGNIYTLIADKAARMDGAEESVRLDGLKADAALPDGSWISTTAATGIYAIKAQTLTLSSGIKVYHDSGYEAVLETATLSLPDHKITSQDKLTATGPLGEIRAAGIETFDGGTRVIFAGPVKVKFYRLGG